MLCMSMSPRTSDLPWILLRQAAELFQIRLSWVSEGNEKELVAETSRIGRCAAASNRLARRRSLPTYRSPRLWQNKSIVTARDVLERLRTERRNIPDSR